MTIKVLIVDDHQIFRRGVRSLLEDESDMKVVAEAETPMTQSTWSSDIGPT